MDVGAKPTNRRVPAIRGTCRGVRGDSQRIKLSELGGGLREESEWGGSPKSTDIPGGKKKKLWHDERHKKEHKGCQLKPDLDLQISNGGGSMESGGV